MAEPLLMAENLMGKNRAPADSIWPRLPALAQWQDTCATLHMWTQIVGKIQLELSPWLNHSWGAALHLTTRGLGTPLIPNGPHSFAIDFDFLAHALVISTTDGGMRSFPLAPMSVADFFDRTFHALDELAIDVKIFPRPVEVQRAIRFPDDHEHASYAGDAVQLYFRALVQAQRVFSEFRARFIGKVSPVHFFWGAFDLAVSRFSGRPAPKHPGGIPNCADWVMQEAYSHEVSSAGFWPGTGLGDAAFYAYAYPAPSGFAQAAVQPSAAYFHAGLGEFILPYEAVRTAADPDQTLLAFLQTTYEAGAVLGAWDRDALERALPASRSWRARHI
jgi:uncharacterized protein DUF5996